MVATISADIVSSTSLSRDSVIFLSERIKENLKELEVVYPGFWGRLIKGDAIECIVFNPHDSLRIALMLKAFVKSFGKIDGNERFKQYGLRVAIGIGEMRTIDRKNDIMDGDSIYRSGRALSQMDGRNKDSLQIICDKDELSKSLTVIGSLLNQIINESTNRQSEILFHRLQSNNDIETAKKLNVSRPGITKSLNRMGWGVIEQALRYFEHIDF